VKIEFFHKKQLGKQENNTSHPYPCAGRMIWCIGVRGEVMVDVPCAGAHGFMHIGS